jgi:NAD(P)-dependent dehydrogenase (short-subunit alcohol dehydrogenase family)
VRRLRRKTDGVVDVLVNNAAAQWPKEEIEQITTEQLDRTFNILHPNGGDYVST